MAKQKTEYKEMVDWIVKHEEIPDDALQVEKIFTVQVTSRACNIPLNEVAIDVLNLKRAKDSLRRKM